VSTTQKSWQARDWDVLTGNRFHITTAYDILRMKGVDVGKMDFLNGSGLKPLESLEKKE
jgi:hypothetical protein